MRILALDLATRTGWALWDGKERTSGFKDFKGESLGSRFLDFQTFVHLWRPWYDDSGFCFKGAERVYYEKPISTINANFSRIAFGFAALVEAQCARDGVPCDGTINSHAIKKWTTGSGNAKKPAMVSAVNERFGPPFVTDHNEADAIALLEYVRRELLPKETE